MSVPDFKALGEPPAPQIECLADIIPEPKPKKKKKKVVEDEEKEPPKKKTKAEPEVAPEERNALVFTVKQYQNNKILGPFLKGKVDFKNVEKLPAKELKDKLSQIELALADRGASEIVDASIKWFMQLMEGLVSNRTIYNIRGTSEALLSDEHWLFLLERTKMKYGLNFAPKMDPLFELTLVTMQTAFVAMKKNEIELLKNDTDLEKKLDEVRVTEFFSEAQTK